jgi:inosine-uridine nucleoside N-ribohydrolase
MKKILFLTMVFLIGRTALAWQRDVILTTDCGADIDDQFALSYLLMIPQVHLKGIVTTHAPNLPKNAQSSAACVNDVMNHMGLDASARPPVFAGSDVALAGNSPLRNRGVDFILNTSRNYSAANRLLVLTIGATTDVGSAFLEDPTLGDRVEILTMGFTSWSNASDPWNIKNDPLAYQIILASRAPITIGGTEVCQKHLTLGKQSAAQLLSGHGPFANWLDTLFNDWLKNNADLTAQVVSPGHWVVWDTVVVAQILGLTTTENHPRPVMNPVDRSFSISKNGKDVHWITSIDEHRMWADFVVRLDHLKDETTKSASGEQLR